MRKLLIAAITIFILFTFISVASAKQSFDRTGKPQTITVIMHDSLDGLRRAYEAFTHQTNRRSTINGWARWTNKEKSGCEIHIVRPGRKITKGKSAILGHELFHCLYGTYHL